jgi:diguanylate cyclase
MHHAAANHYNMYLVFLSFIIALLASYTSLNLARKISASYGWYQKLWIVCSSVAMGIGIWSMHFIAMLAFPLPDGVTYQLQALIISMVFAIIGTIIGFIVTFRSMLKIARIVFGGIFMGFAVSGMHYIEMSAINQVKIRYLPLPFTLSIITAVFASIIALHIASNRNQRFMLNGLIIGAAIMCMHYTGMSAAVVTYPETLPMPSTQATNMDYFDLAMYVAFGTIVILASSLTSSLISEQRLSEQLQLKASVLDSSLDSIMMFNHRGWIIEFNPAAEATFGYSRKEALCRTLFDFLFLFDQDGQGAAALFRLLARKDDSVIGKRVEMMAYRSDRTEFLAEVTITGTQVAGKQFYIIYLCDLTKKKKSENMLLSMM